MSCRSWVIVASLTALAGCDRPATVVTVPATKRSVDIEVQGPRGKVDVERNKDGQVDVNVNRSKP